MNAKLILGSAALAVAALLSAPAAMAEDGVWKVGATYVVRHETLDLATLDGRRELLEMVEKAAERICRTEPTLTDRRACRAAVVEQALAQSPEATREAVADARIERDGSVLAQR